MAVSLSPGAVRGTRPLRRTLVGVVVLALAATLLAFVQTAAHAAPVLLSQNKNVTSSSVENVGTPASNAVDGDNGTRWSSAASDPQWITVDLGATRAVSQVVLRWETAYAKAYRVEFSTDNQNWTSKYSTTTSNGGNETLNVSGNARYVRVYGTQRATQWGYSLWEFQVFGEDGGSNPGGPITGGGDLGPNVKVFDPSTPNIQGQVDSIFQQQESAQFGNGRYQLLFKPGTYNNLNVQLGFYTSISGLGLKPDDTNFNGDVTVDAGWFNGNATQNFWRSAENLAIKPVSGDDRWAVAQAAPFRRMHIKGGLNLAPAGYGWASGGYIADSKIDGTVGPYSQQQWYTRDSSVGGWTNAVWNMVFSGVEGAPAQSFPNPPYTTLNNTPVSREKPFLYLDGNDYKVFVPAKRENARGVSWAGTPQGQSVPLNQFYVAKPGVSADTLNQALDQGLNLLFTPGIYHLNKTVNVNRANTVVLGLGYATLIPDNGVTAMKVADVDGVKLAGLLLDAGAVNSPSLLEVGTAGSHVDHAANPTSVQDVFARVGGAGPGKVTTAFVVNSDDTIIDHTWIWRADHGAGVGWETNRADYGLTVNGNDVLATGLFVEHFNKYDVQWNGERGRTIFFQNEKAYDAPNQAAIQNGSIQGYAAYKVADSVTTHEGWGLGSYCNYTADPGIKQDHGFQAPVKPGVKFHDLLVVSLGGMGQYNHVINNTGGATSGTSTVPSTVTSFP
ncbi:MULTISPECIES: discoidin domain-containing protein [unclassified Streptomyces]|uniref:discoidin domain-containing protein n=1 Tax=Streptomyces TaxID=1883 RepID=UPI0001DEE0A4|nr:MULTISPECIES: discoidin domain-containing protein [unclassified Streptomyces]EFL04256.1 secreted protein [Streptomyces sp. SPB78]MDT0423879.1 discoidin domain-containing protein [Streptomyces sp. DSM 41859]MYR25264.1 coagulation factor 5/8 type domain-containing protein [Streptomyces sp. SID4945]SCD79669.1 F5/8 type C domain-containing protein [Streptomyces sp. TverLS-915]SCE77440.1 F5/8 type C domain-containing protein [Streptomyces sp. LcepLS]